MGHVRGAVPFKVDFVCVLLTLGNGKPMRAMILSVSEVGVRTHLMCNVVLENGVIQQMPIRRDLFLAAQTAGDVISLVEAPDSRGALALVNPNGKILSWDRDNG